jgi:hypothetical protein
MLWALAATVLVPHVQQVQRSTDVKVPVAAVGASSNCACATCPTTVTSLMSECPLLVWALVATVRVPHIQQ